MRGGYQAAVLGAMALLAACHRGESGADGGERTAPRTIGVTLRTRDTEFYHELERGIRVAADSAGYHLIIASGDDDLTRQQSQIQNFIVQRVDAIIVCPVDARGIAPTVSQAEGAGIPVFATAIGVEGVPVKAYVTSNDLEGGRLAAAYLARALDGRGRVAILGEPADRTGADRDQGFREEMAKHPDIAVSTTAGVLGERELARQAAGALLRADSALNAIFALDDESALGALAAAREEGDDSLMIVGYEATPEARRAILEGSALKADVALQPELIGGRTIDAVTAWFQTGRGTGEVQVPVQVVDSSALAEQD